MSLLSKFKTFAEKVGAELEKLFGSGKWEQTAQSVIKYVAPLLETLTELAAGQPAEQLVAEIVNDAQSDLATLSAIVTGATSSPSASATITAMTVLNSIKANFSALLADAGVKNSTQVSKITAIADTIIGEADALLSSIPEPVDIPPTPAAAPKS